MRQVRVYICTICVAAVGALALLYWVAPELDARYPSIAISFAVLGLFSQLLAYGLARSATGSIAFIPFVAGAALAPSWITPIAVAASLLLGQLSTRRPPVKILFNVSQHAFATSIGILVYLACGGTPLLEGRFSSPIAFIAMFATFMGLNTLAVSGVIALSEHRSPLKVWRENTLGSVGYDLLSLPVVYGFAVVYGHFGALGAVAMVVPLVGIRQQYKTNWQLAKVNQEYLQLMVAAIEARDPYTSGHSQRVSKYAKYIAQVAGLSLRQIDRVGIAALLHDVGKIHEEYAPILRKPDRLTDEEMAVMQTHPGKGADLVSNVSQLRDLVAPIRHHHENWDGTGYPDRLAGASIPLYSRIIKIADTIDAMATDRPYRAALSERDIRSELVQFRGIQFDPLLIDAILSGGKLEAMIGSSRDSRTPVLTPRLRYPTPRLASLRTESRAS